MFDPHFGKETPKPLKTRLISTWLQIENKLNIIIDFIFDHGRDFCILIDFSVHLLLILKSVNFFEPQFWFWLQNRVETYIRVFVINFIHTPQAHCDC